MTKYGHSILRGLTVLTTAALLTLTSAEAAIQHRTSEAEAAQETLQTDSINAAEDTLQVKPWPYNVREAVDSLLASPMFSTSMIGIKIYDLTADSAIFEHNARQLMRPASTLKMMTGVTALRQLGPDHAFTTSVYYSGSIDSCVLTGNIYCKGGFDPAFNTADMRAFARSIKALGIDTIRGNIIADRSMKDSDLLGEGWCWDDDNPALSPLLVNRKDSFAEQLARHLRQDSIVITGVTDTGIVPKGSKEICRRQRTLMDILPRMMKRSDNLYAEAIFYNLAQKFSKGKKATARQGRQAINRIISECGHTPSNYYIADGSGLSLYTYVSPELEVDFLRYAYADKSIYDSLLVTLPIAGIDGTLAKRMGNSAAYNNVYAKTGTVTGISSLAGYCTASNGHRLCFSIINMGIRKAAQGRNIQDKICDAMCRDYTPKTGSEPDGERQQAD